MNPLKLFESTGPSGAPGRWDWAKATSIALGAGAVMLIGGLTLGKQLGVVPEELASSAIGALLVYALAKFGLKSQAGVDPSKPAVDTEEGE